MQILYPRRRITIAIATPHDQHLLENLRHFAKLDRFVIHPALVGGAGEPLVEGRIVEAYGPAGGLSDVLGYLKEHYVQPYGAVVTAEVVHII